MSTESPERWGMLGNVEEYRGVLGVWTHGIYSPLPSGARWEIRFADKSKSVNGIEKPVVLKPEPVGPFQVVYSFADNRTESYRSDNIALETGKSHEILVAKAYTLDLAKEVTRRGLNVLQVLRDSLFDYQCCKCGRKGDDVTWVCVGCERKVCRDCTLVVPESSPRIYYYDTLCSTECWEAIGSPEE